MLLKLIIVVTALALGATLLLRKPPARRIGWIVTGSLMVLGLLAVQPLCALDTQLR